MFSEFDAILRKEQKVAAVAQQQSRIMAFLAPNPYITNNIFYPPSVHTPRPPTRFAFKERCQQCLLNIYLLSFGYCIADFRNLVMSVPESVAKCCKGCPKLHAPRQGANSVDLQVQSLGCSDAAISPSITPPAFFPSRSQQTSLKRAHRLRK